MGIYSHNRVAGVAGNVNEATAEAKTAEVEATMENFELTPDFSIGCALEAVLQMYENDAKMFDTLIECDFMEAENGFIMNESEAEAVREAADEKKTNGIVEKIKMTIERFVEFIKKAAANLIAKFVDLVKSDKKIVEQYRKTLTVENLNDFRGIANFAEPKFINGQTVDVGFDEFGNYVTKFLQDMEGFASIVDSENKFKETLDAFKEKTEAFMKQVEEKVNYVNMDKTKEDFWKFKTNSQIKNALDVLENSNKTTKDIKNNTNRIMTSMKGMSIVYKFYGSKMMEKPMKDAGLHDLPTNAKYGYDFTSSVVKGYSKLFNAYTKGLVREYGQIRKAVILCGRASTKAVKGVEEAVDMDLNFAVESAIMESSDVFMMEHFEYAY